jgi:hypothetical protein
MTTGRRRGKELDGSFEILSIDDLDRIAVAVGLPVGPRTGPRKRTQDKTEWYVLLKFLKRAIPADVFELPIAIRHGLPPSEPDFVVTRRGVIDEEIIALVEITEATDESDQREMTEFERSGKSVALLGEFDGRFAGGASWTGSIWASDIVDAIKRKSGKAIFRSSPEARHLIVYPNSNASFLLFDEQDEREAICDLRDAIGKEATSLTETTNGCHVHVLGKTCICTDILTMLAVS